MTARTNGTVKATSRSGGARAATVEYPPTVEHPAGETVTYESLDSETYADLRAALAGGLVVDVTSDDALPGKPIQTIALRKP